MQTEFSSQVSSFTAHSLTSVVEKFTWDKVKKRSHFTPDEQKIKYIYDSPIQHSFVNKYFNDKLVPLAMSSTRYAQLALCK